MVVLINKQKLGSYAFTWPMFYEPWCYEQGNIVVLIKFDLMQLNSHYGNRTTDLGQASLLSHSSTNRPLHCIPVRRCPQTRDKMPGHSVSPSTCAMVCPYVMLTMAMKLPFGEEKQCNYKVAPKLVDANLICTGTFYLCTCHCLSQHIYRSFTLPLDLDGSSVRILHWR